MHRKFECGDVTAYLNVTGAEFFKPFLKQKPTPQSSFLLTALEEKTKECLSLVSMLES